MGTTREEAPEAIGELMASWNYRSMLNLETTKRTERKGAAA
jgi:hypothetical protein